MGGPNAGTTWNHFGETGWLALASVCPGGQNLVGKSNPAGRFQKILAGCKNNHRMAFLSELNSGCRQGANPDHQVWET